MALDHPEDEVSALWKVAVYDGKYRECPYLQSNRQGQCVYFRQYGPLACFTCGYRDGIEDGYDYGYEDGRNEPDFEDMIAEQEDRYAGMD